MHVLNKLGKELGVELGTVPLTWQVGSLHIYERHFYLIDHYTRTGEINITRKTYDALHPESRWTAKNISLRVAGEVHEDGKANINLEQRSIF
jgi:thymidylate synthase